MASIQKKNIGLLGGSFDPAHKGHLGVSNIAIKKLKLKKIYWVITKKNTSEYWVVVLTLHIKDT